MKLYYSKGACSLAVRITIHELGVPCEFEAVNLQTKQTETGADYLKINPKGSVPALSLDNKELLTENAALQQYLAETHPPSLLPLEGDLNRYRTLEWLSFISSDLHKGCGPLFNAKLPQAIKDEFFKPVLKNKIAMLDQHFSNHQYLLDKQFTCADSYLFVVLSWLHHFNIELTEWPNVARYFAEVMGRPAVQKALKEEGISF
jgi:glutathione S-transferase